MSENIKVIFEDGSVEAFGTNRPILEVKAQFEEGETPELSIGDYYAYIVPNAQFYGILKLINKSVIHSVITITVRNQIGHCYSLSHMHGHCGIKARPANKEEKAFIDDYIDKRPKREITEINLQLAELGLKWDKKKKQIIQL